MAPTPAKRAANRAVARPATPAADWPATWAADGRLVLGPAPTVGDLLAALVEFMTATGAEPRDVEFDEVPAGRRLFASL